jgi:hypothetical protein
VKRYTIRYTKRDTRVAQLRLLWFVEGVPTPFQTDNFDVSAQAVDTEAVYEKARVATATWPAPTTAPPAVDKPITGIGTLTATGVSVSGPGAGMARVINIANRNTTLARTLRVTADGKTYNYTIQPGGRLGFVLRGTPTTDSVEFIDPAGSGDLEGGFADLTIPGEVSTLGLSVLAEERDATGALLAASETLVDMIAVDLGQVAVGGDIIITTGGGD